MALSEDGALSSFHGENLRPILAKIASTSRVSETGEMPGTATIFQMVPRANPEVDARFLALAI